MDPDRWQRVDRLLQTALELPPDRREAFLRGACPDDPSLAGEVRSLIEAHEKAGNFLERPAVGMAARELTDGTLTAVSLGDADRLAGQIVSHYRVVGRVGGGGMGIVYRAEDTRLGRPVALKFLAPEYAAAPEALGRFRREARAASALNHPNICTVYDVGLQDGRSFIAMEFLEGTTLHERLADGPLDLDTLLRTADQVLEALDAAHGAGIIHRDLKPANLFLTTRGHAKVLDFGIAKVHPVGRVGAAETTVVDDRTAPGAAVGTVSYMSPEQVRGEPVDARSDLFSMGVVLYEMATGTRPFRGDTAGVIFDAILNRDPTAPTMLNAALPAALDGIILKCLAKSPQERYASAAELRRELSQLRQGASGQEPASARVRKARTARMVAGTLAGGVLAFVAAIAGFTYFRTPAALTDEDTIVIADFDNTTGDPVFDGVLRQGLSMQLAQSPFLSLVSDSRIRHHLKLMEQPSDATLNRQLARDVCVRNGSAAVVAGSIASLGTQYVLGLKAEACDTGELIHDAQEQAATKEEVLTVLSRMAAAFRTEVGESLASIRRHSKPLPEATTRSIEALQVYQRGLDVHGRISPAASVPHFQGAIELDPTFAMAHAILGISYSIMGESTLSSESTGRAYELRDRVTDSERFFITAMYDRQVTGNLERLRQTYEAWARTYPRDPNPHGLLAGYCANGTGAFEAAVEHARRAIALDPDVPLAYISLAFANLSLGRLDEAEATIRLAAERARVAGTTQSEPEHDEFTKVRYFIALVKGDADEMRRQAARAERDPIMAHIEALVAARAGRIDEARKRVRVALELAGEHRELAATFLASNSVWEAFYGQMDAARARATEALEISKGRDVQYPAALALARAGETGRARALTEDLERRFPEDTAVRFNYLPVLRAQLALKANAAETALLALEAASRLELSAPGVAHNTFFGALYPAFLRGEAYLALQQPDRAAGEFARIIEHRGMVLGDPVDAMARLQRARALTASGDAAGARAAYQDLVNLWGAADRETALIERANTEYAALR